MPDLTEEMRSGPFALFAAYSVIGLSLWALNMDTVARFSREVLSRAPIMATVARNSAPAEVKKRLPLTRVTHAGDSAVFLSMLNRNLKLEDLPNVSFNADDAAARRKAAFALLIYGAMKSAKGAPG